MSAISDDSALLRLLEPDATGIISARCCSADAVLQEQKLRDRLELAMQRTGRQHEVTVETITNAQRALIFLGPRLDQRQRSLVSHLLGLFQEHGLSLFPVLIINGEVVAHSDVPSAEAIGDWLNAGSSNDHHAGMTGGDAREDHQIQESLGRLGGDGCCSTSMSIQTEPEEYPFPERLRDS